MTNNADIRTLRELLYDAGVLCSRLSSAVSLGELPPQVAAEVAATRNCVLAAQQCGSLIEQYMDLVESMRHTGKHHLLGKSEP